MKRCSHSVSTRIAWFAVYTTSTYRNGICTDNTTPIYVGHLNPRDRKVNASAPISVFIRNVSADYLQIVGNATGVEKGMREIAWKLNNDSGFPIQERQNWPVCARFVPA
jgi:hypothetical protein